MKNHCWPADERQMNDDGMRGARLALALRPR